MMNSTTSKKFARGTKARDRSVRVKILLWICLVGLFGTRLHAQAVPTASAAGLLQVGGMFNLADSDYIPQKIKGGGFYATFDFKYHFGIEGEFHQLNDSQPSAIYERTYEIGPRYVRRYGRLAPYAKGMYGRGVFNYPPVFGDPHGGAAANLAYNLAAVGVGADYRVLRFMNVRGEYEFQRWFSFPPNGLTPGILSVGVAYQFH
jgi:Outer membrane protein beta-barrel domain